jgi:hypothetical protein
MEARADFSDFVLAALHYGALGTACQWFTFYN